MKKNKTLKRFLAFLLCAAMMVTYMPSSVYTLADDSAEATSASEPVEAAPAPETKAEPVQDQAETKSDAPETPVVENNDPTPEVQEEESPVVPEEETVVDESAASENDTRAGPDAEEEAAEDADAKEEKDESKLNEEKLTFTGKANSVNVKVVAAPGTFPEGTEMKVSYVAKSEVKDAVESALDDVKNFKAVDITFYADGKEVQPKKNVAVKLSTSALDASSDLNVVHVEDSGEGQVMDLTKASDTMAQFKTDGFSIYVVVETGDDARLLVKFMNGNTEIDSMYVKKDDNMEQVLYDPGTGEIGNGVYFRGWTDNPDYTIDTEALTIEDVRTAVSGMLPPSKDGDEKVYYAMLFKDYRVTYLDENNISLGQEEVTFRADSANTNQPYTVNMGYTVQDDTHHFEGWNVVEGGSNINGYTSGKIYENNEQITISGDVTFGVNAPEGHWFIFNENGKGATYNAPQFVYKNATPRKPDDSKMIRNGYTFGGWYATKAEADQQSGGTQYDFSKTLTDKTQVWARWTPKATAGYTVIIWKENLAGTGYDFAEAVHLTGNVNTTVNTVTQQGTGDNAYARVNGVNKQYTGFHLKEFDQNKTIAPEGNTVVNVYYDRTEYTLTFQVNRGGYWQDDWQTVKTITAKYQQPIGDNFPIVGTDGTNYSTSRWDPQQNSVGLNRVIVYLDIMPAGNVTFHQDTANFSTKHIHYYVEALPGATDTRRYNGMDFVEYKSIDANYNYFTEAEDYLDFVGYTKGGNAYPPQGFNANGGTVRTIWENSNAINVYCYYTRNEYPINFMDGKYVDGNGNPIDEAGQGQIAEIDNIVYEASTAEYNNYKPDTAHTPSGFVFEGWYIDSECTHKYDFTTMPEGGITVYAKWRQKEYRVFLHPNYPDGATGNIDWGTDRQAMNFRVAEGKNVSEPTGKLNGYEFVGWYMDEACTEVFNGEAYVINESNVTTPYDKSVDMTDTYDQNGNLIDPKFNSDATGYEGGDRFWITKKLDIYAKWRSTLEGASGIVVEYDANGGTGAPTDTHTYVDGAKAPAGAASKAPANSGKVFGHWVVQKWNGSAWEDTTEKVLPGDTFTVLASNAKVEDIANPQPGGDTKKYTVKLKAEYIDSEQPTPTHIFWYKNDGTDAYQKDTPLAINEPVDIPSAPSRDGYEFKGWARVDIGNTLDAATAWEADSNNWKQDTTALFLTYSDGAYTSGGNAATKVAADEDMPYQAMFAVWEAQDVNYTVEYYFQTAAGTDNYAKNETLKPTATRTAKTDTPVEVTAEDKAAPSTKYVLNSEKKTDWTATVAGDGTTVLKVYFDLNEADVTVHHYLKGTTKKVAEDVTEAATIGSQYTAQPVAQFESKNLTVDSYNPSQPVTVSENGNEITIYYTLPLKITTGSGTKAYDGTALTNAQASIEGLISADQITVEATGSQTEVGSSQNTYKASAAIPGYYVVSEELGTLEVTDNTTKLEVKSSTKSWEYDGAAHTDPVYTVTYGEESGTATKGEDGKYTYELSTGDTITITPAQTATVTHVAEGNVKNAFTYTLENANFYKNVTKTEGDLSITPATLTVTTESAEKEYDGKPLTAPGTVTGYKNNETADFTVTGTRTEVGESTNSYSIVFKGEEGADKATAVRSDYTISETLGKLVVKQTEKELKIVSSTKSWEYDGKAHTDYAYTVTYGDEKYEVKVADGAETAVATLSTGDKVTITPKTSATITHVAETTVDNDYTYVVDHAAQFKTITAEKGTLSVTPATLTVKTESGSKVYDGKALKAPGTVTGFKNGENADFEVTGQQIKVGNSQNTYKIVFKGETGASENATAVKSDYTISEELGTLTVTKGETDVVIASSTKTWEYDGTAHTDPVYTVTYGEESGTATAAEGGTYTYELSTGDVVTITPAATATITHVAETTVDNAFTYELTNAEDYSNVSKTEGKLSVTPATLTITTGTATKVYDGDPLTAEGTITGFKNNETATFTVTGTITNAGGPVDNTYTLVWDGTAVESDYTLSENIGTLTVKRRQITYTSPDATKAYDGKALTTKADEIIVDGEWVKDEGVDVTMTGTQTLVGSSSNTFTYEWKEGTNKDNYIFEQKYGTLTVTDGKDEDVVNKTDNSDKAYHVGDTVEWTVTVTNIYDEEKTLTVTEAAGMTIVSPSPLPEKLAAGESVEIKVEHVVTVADIKAKSIKNEVTVKLGDIEKTGDDEVPTEPIEITIKADDAKKVYDGEALTKDSWKQTAGTLAADNEIESVTVTGSQTLVGSSDNVPSDAKIVDKDGKDVTEGYKIKYENGTLTVTDGTKPDEPDVPDNKVVTKSDDSEKAYHLGDTVEWTVWVKNIYDEEKTLTVTETEGMEIVAPTPLPEKLEAGEEIEITVQHVVTVEDVVAKTIKNTVNVKLGDLEKTGEDEVPTEPIKITIKANDAEKVYDGKPLTDDGYEVSEGTLAEGNKVDSVTVTGSQTDAGESDNVPSDAKIVDKDGKDVTKGYDISYANGTLKVTPVTDEVVVTIKGHKDEVTYDGTEQKVEGYDVSIDNELYTEEDFSFSGEAVVEETNAADDPYPMGLAEDQFKNESKNFANVKFVVEDGSLKINKRDLTITSPDDEKVYDGTPLTNHNVTIEGLAPADEGKLAVEVTGSQTYVGSSPNTFKYQWKGEDSWTEAALETVKSYFVVYAADDTSVADNYNVSTVEGTLTVTDDTDDSNVITKTHEDKKYKVGETITFTIEVTNIYDEPKTITIKEQAGVTITGPTVFKDVAPGETVTTMAEHKVTAADVKAGKYHNTAKASFDGGRTFDGDDEVDKFQKPNPGNGPDTGDHNGLAGMIGLFGASMAGLFAMLFRRRREQE